MPRPSDTDVRSARFFALVLVAILFATCIVIILMSWAGGGSRAAAEADRASAARTSP